MKIRYLSLIVLLVMSVFAPIQAQTYDNLWKELEVLERKAIACPSSCGISQVDRYRLLLLLLVEY